MKKTILIFGLISGVFCSVMMVITLPLAHRMGFDKAEILGYTSMVLMFLLVYFGIRSYRDNVCHGQITFVKAFAVGISIALIGCVFYTATWEVIFFRFSHDFIDKYAAYTVEKLKASNASPAEVEAQVQKMAQFKKLYNNPVYNTAMTFLEPLPVGLAMTLLSAALLRRKSQAQTPAAVQVTS